MRTTYSRCTMIVALISCCMQIGTAAQYTEGTTYRHELTNGLVIFTMERHIAPLIYHQLTYRVGSRNEHLGITGISHIVEHLMFKGTPKYGKGKASKTISKNSGTFNAFTANDLTSYYEYLPANKIDIAMEIESDRMKNCMFDTSEFRSEVQVIKQERRMRTESTASGVMSEYMNAVAYMSHPNRDPIIGWPGDLDNVTRDEAYQYYKTYYTPNNAFLVLVGDFHTDAIVKLAEQYYGSIEKGPQTHELRLNEQLQRAKKTVTLWHNDFTSPRLQMAFHVPTIQHPDGPALKLAGSILGARSRTSRLYKSLVDGAQIASSVAAGMQTAKDPGLFRITAGVKADSSIETTEKLVWAELKKLQTELVTEHELQKEKNKFVFGEVTNYTKNADIGGKLSTYEAFFGIDYIGAFSKTVAAVTREDIQRVMKKYFSEELSTVFYGLPKGPHKRGADTEQPLDETGVESKFQICPIGELDDDAVFTFQPWSESAVLGSGDIDMSSVLKPNPIAPLIKKNTLANGVTIYTIENHLSPSIFLGGFFETGVIPEAIEGGKPGIVSTMSDVMGHGTVKTDNETLSERMAFVPFTFAVSGSYKSISFQGFSLLKDAEEMAATGFEIVTQPAFKQSDIDVSIGRQMERAKSRNKATREASFSYMFNKVFRSNPFSQSDPTEQSLASITREDLVKLHRLYLAPSRLTIVMVGDMTHKEMIALANKQFGAWKVESPAPAIAPFPNALPLTGREIKAFVDKEYTESTINIGFAPLNDIDAISEETMSVMNTILAGSVLTSRMGQELRDKKGYIYGLKSQLWNAGEHVGYWKMQTKTAPKNTQPVIAGIFSEIEKFQKFGITDSELVYAKGRLLGMIPFYVETPDDIASKAFEMMRNKQSFDTFDKTADRLLAVTKDDVLAASKKIFTLDRFVIVVDGPLEQKAFDGLLGTLPH